jgi:voltage-gated potassium channel
MAQTVKDASRTAITLRILWKRLRKIAPMFLGVYLATVFLLNAIEPGAPDGHFDKLSDAFWFGVVTMSTVGYGDVYPVTALGRAITGFFILFTLGTLGLLITAVSEAVMEVKRMEEHGLIGTRMKGHVIVCGFNSMARAALAELVAQERKVALLCESQSEIEAARDYQRAPGGMYITAGEPSQELFQDRLNAKEADAVIVAMSDDTKNLIATLNVKAVNPSARLVVALQREELRQTLMAGGVTYIASPNELSGRLVASAAFEPEVAVLLEDLMSSEVGGSDMQQYTAGPLGGRTVGELRDLLNGLDGPLLVAVGKKDGNGFRVVPNPKKDMSITAEDQIIVISDDEQAEHLESKYKVHQGR